MCFIYYGQHSGYFFCSSQLYAGHARWPMSRKGFGICKNALLRSGLSSRSHCSACITGKQLVPGTHEDAFQAANKPSAIAVPREAALNIAKLAASISFSKTLHQMIHPYTDYHPESISNYIIKFKKTSTHKKLCKLNRY